MRGLQLAFAVVAIARDSTRDLLAAETGVRK